MEDKTGMNPRTIVLFALLNESIGTKSNGRLGEMEIDRITASASFANMHGGDSLRLYSLAFIQAPRHQSGYERVLYPVSIAFSINNDRSPVAHLTSSFALSSGRFIEQNVRAFLAVLTYLLRRKMISESTFHRSIEISLKNPAGDRILRTVEEFPQWAAHVLKTSPYLDYDASEAACAELRAYVAPGSHKAAA